MSRFTVKAATAEGRVTTKEVEADSREEVELKLEKEGLFPIEVKPRSGEGLTYTLLSGRKKTIKRSEFLVFNKSLVALLNAGLPITECLDTLSHLLKNEAFKTAVNDAQREIEHGKTLSEAMSLNPDIFPSLYTASISSGERTGDLVPAVKDYVNYQKRIEAIRKKVVSSLTYPVSLTCFTTLIIVFLLIYVVPRFSKIYGDVGGDLPVASKMLMSLSTNFVTYLPFIIIALISLVVFVRFYLKSARGALMFDRVLLGFPQLGEVYRSYTVAKFARTLSMVLRSGVPLVTALEMSKGVLDNKLLERRLDEVVRKTREGQPLTKAMGEAEMFPEISLKMLGVGERSASLSAMLSDIADYHDEDVDHKARIITSLLEPTLMIVMGLIIGGIVLLIYLPIFYLVGADF